MNPTRAVMWMFGVVVLLAGAYLLYFEADLNRWVSIGVLGAGFLIFIGLAVMTFAGSSPNDPTNPTVIAAQQPAQAGTPVVIDQHTTNVRRDDGHRQR